MKPSLVPDGRKSLDRAAARNFALLNQLATPGLGSLMAGRVIGGIAQLALAVAGFVMVAAWFTELSIQLYRQIDGDSEPKSYAWLGEAGAVTFGAAWLCSLVTSLSLLRQAKTQMRAGPERVPPRIAGPPPANSGTPG
jgi:hypothetical protein